MNANLSIEAGGGEHAWVARRPLNFERPIGAGWELADDIARLRVPADGAIVFTTREEEIGVLLAPGEGENALVVAREDLDSVIERQGVSDTSLTVVVRIIEENGEDAWKC